MPVHSWIQDSSAGNERLDSALAAQVPELSRAAAQRLIREGAVSVDDRTVTRPSYVLSAGHSVQAQLPEASGGGISAMPGQVSIVYEDDHVTVVDKPAGVPVHPGSGHTDDTLVNFLLTRYPAMGAVGERDRPGVVHRLDRDTSGLLVFALTQRAYEALVTALKSRSVSRSYLALVHGRPDPAEGIVDAPIGRDPHNRTRQAIVEGGKSARTRFRVVRETGPWSLLELNLESGRMHQIRVHLASIGYPVAGDPAYGRAPRIPGLERQFLHAVRLSFAHPVTGESMEFQSELPPDLRFVLEGLERSA